MAHIVNSPFSAQATPAGMVRRKVDQHSLAVARAMYNAEQSKVNDLSLFELINVVNARITDTNGLDFVDKHSLFTLYVHIDTELQARRDALENEMFTNAGIEHAVNPLSGSTDDNDEHIHASEITLAEWEAVRAIHAEVFDERFEMDVDYMDARG